MKTENNPLHHHPHSELISILLECGEACERCMSACLDEADVTRMARCIELDRDCAEICFSGARLLMRDAVIGHKYLNICEEACRMCAEECSKHQHDHCKKCAHSCKKCADACHKHNELTMNQ